MIPMNFLKQHFTLNFRAFKFYPQLGRRLEEMDSCLSLGFSSSRLVAWPRLNNPVCPTFYPQLGRGLEEFPSFVADRFFFSFWIPKKENAPGVIQTCLFQNLVKNAKLDKATKTVRIWSILLLSVFPLYSMLYCWSCCSSYRSNSI